MSFADYMNSLGATRRPITGKRIEDTATPWGRSVNTGKIDYSLGQKVPTFQDQGLFNKKDAAGNQYGYQYDFGYNTGHNPNVTDYTSGYVDGDGGFLGYGRSIDSLQDNPRLSNQYSEYAANEPGRLADVEAKNISNQQARLQYEQDYQAAQAAKLAAQAQQPHFQGQGLVGMGQAPQQSSMGRGSGFAPGQQYAGGMGRGSGAGLLGGMGRGGGQ